MPSKRLPRIALTTGEPSGIGLDLACMLATATGNAAKHAQIIVCANRDALETRAETLGIRLKLRAFNPDDNTPATPGELIIKHFATAKPVVAGDLDTKNAQHVLAMLDYAANNCMNNEFDAMVTGPVHKGVINDSGLAFTGHTEYLAEMAQAYPVMMLATDSLRVALATTHLPLRDVADAITPDLLEKVLHILHADLQQKFAIDNPHILVCGLNPHAGESGHMGREEIDVIEPVLKKLGEQGLNITGPLPADTLFTPRLLDTADAVLAMYHDQGLPVLKYAGFGRAVNITLGLPFIRTSVDHGTALDLAGTGNINSGSLQTALELAISLAESRCRVANK